MREYQNLTLLTEELNAGDVVIMIDEPAVIVSANPSQGYENMTVLEYRYLGEDRHYTRVWVNNAFFEKVTGLEGME